MVRWYGHTVRRKDDRIPKISQYEGKSKTSEKVGQELEVSKKKCRRRIEIYGEADWKHDNDDISKVKSITEH